MALLLYSPMALLLYSLLQNIVKEPSTRDYILQKRPIIVRSLLNVATPYIYIYTNEKRLKERDRVREIYVYVCMCMYTCILEKRPVCRLQRDLYTDAKETHLSEIASFGARQRSSCTCASAMHTYIHMKREREREREIHIKICVYIHICIYIHIHMRRDLYADVKTHTCAKLRLLVRDLLAKEPSTKDVNT